MKSSLISALEEPFQDRRWARAYFTYINNPEYCLTV